MNKCFITKLPSSIDNDNLPVLGQLKINWLKQSNLTDNAARLIKLQTNDNITVKVYGAHFTDYTLTSNIGNTKIITAADGEAELYISNDEDAVLTIDNKYSLQILDFGMSNNGLVNKPIYFDISDIRYCNNLTKLNLLRTQVSGDVSAISNFTNLVYLVLAATQVVGDISAINNLTNLVYINIGDTKISGYVNAVSKLTKTEALILANMPISGDVSAISNLTNLNILYLADTKVSGDISAIRNLTNIHEMYINDSNISGDIASLVNLTKLDAVNLNGLSLTGDMSKIPTNWYDVAFYSRKISTNFTWTANGRQNATLLAIEGNVPFDTTSMDNMLIDQATCTVKTDTRLTNNLISVSGTRTSASDAAVTAIQNMGVTIAGVTKQA